MKYIGGISLGILLAGVIFMGSYHRVSAGGPQKTLDAYFSAGVRQDYAAVYNCYYAAYKAKIGKAEYIRRRKEDAAVLKAYKILSVKQNGSTAQAKVLLTFRPALMTANAKTTDVRVKENLVREGGQWKVQVWG
ncbi:MAG: hypothetical protein M0018_01325 [Nitrospiraceae bacterium]|nr:hypothetical protein [Nitrospiraceae bacterium]